MVSQRNLVFELSGLKNMMTQYMSLFIDLEKIFKVFCLCLGTLPLKEKTWKRQMLT